MSIISINVDRRNKIGMWGMWLAYACYWQNQANIRGKPQVCVPYIGVVKPNKNKR